MKKRIFKNVVSVISLLLIVYWAAVAGGNRPADSPLIARRIPPVQYQKSAKDMIVTFIDVGQGNAILVEAPSGKTLLYDVGGNPEWVRSSWDPGLRIVVPFLNSKGIEKIDYAVISHPHGDHMGGYKAVIYNFDVQEFIDPGFAHPTMLYKELLETIKTRNIRYTISREGDGSKIDLGPGIKVRIFNPPKDFYFRGTPSDVNNNGILMKITYNDVSFLFTGDLEHYGEIYCAKKFGSELEANILQVGHHGSFTSSSKPFLNKVLPEVAVIPVGKNNVFNHPRPEALNNLKSVGAEIYRTDYDGHVTVYTDGKTFIVETEN